MKESDEERLIQELRGKPLPEEWPKIAHRYSSELRLARDYWLKTVRRYVNGRKLSGAELVVADFAYTLLRDAHKIACDWNVREEGRCWPVLQVNEIDWTDDRFAPPESGVSRRQFSPVDLATVAAMFLSQQHQAR